MALPRWIYFLLIAFFFCAIISFVKQFFVRWIVQGKVKTVCESREGEVRAILTRDNLRAQPFDALQTRFIPKQEFVSQFKVQYLQNKNGSPQDLINIDASNKDERRYRVLFFTVPPKKTTKYLEKLKYQNCSANCSSQKILSTRKKQSIRTETTAHVYSCISTLHVGIHFLQ